METDMEEICDICGAVGFGELVAACSKCRINQEHLYCMQTLFKDDIEDWVCESCTSYKGIASSVSSGCERKENTQNCSDTVHHDAAMQGGCPKVFFGLGRHHQLTRQNATKTAKVKFLTTEEVIRLSSGVTKEGSPSKINFSNRTSFYSLTAKLSPSRVKPNPRIIPSYLIKPPGHGRMQSSSTTNQLSPKTLKAPSNLVKEHSCKERQKIACRQPAQDVNTCNASMPAKEIKTCKENVEQQAIDKSSCSYSTPEHVLPDNACHQLANEVHTCNVSIPAKEIKTCRAMAEPTMDKSSCLSSALERGLLNNGMTPCPAAVTTNSDVEKIDLVNILPKLKLYHPYFPALHATWKGGFKFSDTSAEGYFYGGFQAQLPCRVHRRAYEFSKMIPIILQVQLLPKDDIWADLFLDSSPDFRDIALYFFPSVNIKRSKENYAGLFKLLETRNAALRSYVDDIEVLMFTSKHLDMDSQDVIARSGMEPFLWGVFRCAKHDKIHSNELPSLTSTSQNEDYDHTNVDTDEAVDMEIDMIGGNIMGKIDVAIPKESSKSLCMESNKENVDKESSKESMVLNNFMVLDPIIGKAISNSEKSHGLYSEGPEETGNDLVSANPLLSSLGKLFDAVVDADVPPGFEEMSKLTFRNILYKIALEGINRDRDGYLKSDPLVKTESKKFEYGLLDDEVRLNVAGTGNPGVVGAAGIISDVSGNWILGFTLNLCKQRSSMLPELWGIFQGLLLAWQRGFRKVMVESDCRVAVECLKRAPNALDPNRDLINCCLNLIKREWDCKIRYIHGEANLSAKCLATQFEVHPLGVALYTSQPPDVVPHQSDIAQPKSSLKF